MIPDNAARAHGEFGIVLVRASRAWTCGARGEERGQLRAVL